MMWARNRLPMSGPNPPPTLRSQFRQLVWRLALRRQRHGVPVWLSRLDVTRHTVLLPHLPAAAHGLRVVQLTDLHCGALFGEAAVERLVAVTNQQQPDLILITGDFVQTHDERLMHRVLPRLGGLRARLGVYASLGNHDHWDNPELVRDLAGTAGIEMLDNAVAMPLPGLAIAGVDDLMSGSPDLPAVRSAVPAAHAVILLSHSPGILAQLGGRPWLVLAGHTHGLQWAIPGIDTRQALRWPLVGRLAYAMEWWGANMHGASRHTVVSYRYPAGWFQHGATQMYVCRGAGFLQTVPLRLACPSEIAVFELVGA